MKIKFLKDCGVYEKGQVVEMELPRANQYVTAGFAVVVSKAEKTTEKPTAE